ncbi:MAG: 50S ribosomal protein L4 [Candidatus Bipolaricaulia bacterium]
MKVKRHHFDGSAADQIELNEQVFTEPVHRDLLYRAVQMQRTNRRQGTASTKTQGEVAGVDKKPWRQKHIGRARHGSTKSNIWAGGGVVFGPKPRRYRYKLPKRMRRKALRVALSIKHREDRLMVIDRIAFEHPRTKAGIELLERFNFPDKVLVIVSSEEDHPAIRKSFSNIPRAKCLPARGANVYDLLKYEDLLVTEPALRQLEVRACDRDRGQPAEVEEVE